MSDQTIKIIRAILLVLLLVYFAGSVGCALLRQERERGFGRLPSAPGVDPGVRVLLLNRPQLLDRAPPLGSRTFDVLHVQALVPLEITSPDAPDNPDLHATLRTGARLMVKADLNSGLTLTSADFGQGGKDLYWSVSRIVLQPQLTEPAAGAQQQPSRERRDPCTFEAAGRRAAFGIGRNAYRGSLEIRWAGSKEIAAINCLPIEAYLEGVVGIEMSPAWPLEALKAQAVVGRGYAYASQKRARTAGAEQFFDLTDGGDDQEYRGQAGSDICARAVFETRGLVPLIRGNLFLPLFHASSGGRIGGVEPIWPGARDVHGREPLATVMPAQDDPWCQEAVAALGNEATHWRSVAVVKPQDLRREMGKLPQFAGRTIGFIKDIKVGRRDPASGRAITVLIHHAQGDPIELSAHRLRQLVGPNVLRSTLWTPESPRKYESPQQRGTWLYEFTCLGWGHGAGMSQVSCFLMARQGLTMERIIQRFYVGAQLGRLW